MADAAAGAAPGARGRASRNRCWATRIASACTLVLSAETVLLPLPIGDGGFTIGR